MLNWQINNKENALVTLAGAFFGHYKIREVPLTALVSSCDEIKAPGEVEANTSQGWN